MLNVVLLLLLIVACAGLGFLAASRLKQREQAIHGLIDGFKTLAMHMEYADLPLREAFVKTAQTANGCIREMFNEVARNMHNNGLLPAFDNAADGLMVNEADQAVLKNFARNLGNTDRASQRKNFELLQNSLAAQHTDAINEYAKKGRIYRSLGILAGLALAIILI